MQSNVWHGFSLATDENDRIPHSSPLSPCYEVNWNVHTSQSALVHKKPKEHRWQMQQQEL